MRDDRLIRTILAAALVLSFAGVALAQAGQTPQAGKSAEEFFREGTAKALDGDYKSAVEDFTRAIQIDPGNAEAYYQRGLLLTTYPRNAMLMFAERTPTPVSPLSPANDFTTAILLRPKFAEAHLQLGILKGDVNHLDKAIEINPHYAEAYYQRGNVRVEGVIYCLDKARSGKLLFTCKDHLEPGIQDEGLEKVIARLSEVVRRAVEDYTRAINLKPDYADAHFARGSINLELKEYQAAITDLTRVTQLDPQRADAYEKLGQAHSASKDYEAAAEAFTRLISLEPQKATAFVSRARARLEIGDENGAMDDLIQAMRLGAWREDYAAHLPELINHPRAADAYYEAGMAARYQRWDDETHAAESFTRATQLNPKFAGAYYQLGLALADQKKTEQAIAAFDIAVRLNPGDADFYFSRGMARLERKDYGDAARDFTDALKLSPEGASIHYQRGRAYYAAGDNPKAIADFSAAIKNDLQPPEVYYWRGRAYEESGDQAGAIADYISAARDDDGERVDVSQENPGQALLYYRGLARLNLYLNRGSYRDRFWQLTEDQSGEKDENYFDKAVADFSQVIQSDPASPEAYYQRGRARLLSARRSLGSSAKSDSAKADFDKAISLKPDFAEAYLGRALSRKGIGGDNAAKSRADLDTAIRLKPGWARAYYERALSYSVRAQTKAVLNDLTKAIELDPDFAEAYTTRGYIRLHSGDLQGAISDYTELIRRDPDDVEAYRQRGFARLIAKDYRGAAEDYTRAIELYPGTYGSGDRGAANAYLYRAAARYQLGDGRGAVQDYQEGRRVESCPGCISGSASVSNANKAEVFLRKARMLARKGDKSAAKENFQQAAKLYHTAGNMTQYQKVMYQIGKL